MRYQELDIVERLRNEQDALDTEAADEIERLRAALREIAFIDGPQSRGIPRRTSMGTIARKALGEETAFEDRWDNA